MNRRAHRTRTQHAARRALVCAALALLASACAASRGVAPEKPSAGPPYPVTLTASADRERATRDAWARLLTDQGVANPPAPDLQPITATLAAIPSTLAAPLRLPRVGEEGKQMGEEETREALRRFLASATPLLGVQPAELSLETYEDAGGGAKRAVYRQTPFEFPLRGDYGRVEVTFAPDLRVLKLSSTAIPDVERLRRAFAALKQDRLAADKVAATLGGRAVTYVDASGNVQTRTVAQGEAQPREVVVYPVLSAADPSTLELHLAWEVLAPGPNPLLVYLDAFSGEQLAARPADDKAVTSDK
jgi:hypothetical protein